VLLLQQLARLALVDLLLVLAPLGLLCWVLPQTQGWARLWSNAFFGAVFTQFVQAVTLKVGTALLADYFTLPTGDAQLISLFLGIATLALTLRVPSLMRATVGGGGMGFVRYYAYRVAARQLGSGEHKSSSAGSGRGNAASARSTGLASASPGGA
jgi:hypothetical protein